MPSRWLLGVVDEGLYGKALGQYLLGRLRERSSDAPFLGCAVTENWFNQIWNDINKHLTL